MKCPSCLSDLMPSTLERYETLCEHVNNPNTIHPLRETFVCPNGCHTGFYGLWGTLYSYDSPPVELWYAVNSPDWQVENWDIWDNFYNFYKIMNKFKDFWRNIK